MNPTQTNTVRGKIMRSAIEDLTAKEGLLCRLINNAGKPGVKLPDANTDRANFIVDDGGPAASNVSIDPLIRERQYRTPVKDGGETGDILVLADVGTAADRGKLRKLPAAAGTYYAVGIAEEHYVAGQNVLWRPTTREAIVVA
jgi:hypothetical protein